MARSLLTFLALTGLLTCLDCYCPHEREKLFFLTEVRNIDDVNSRYDDMNAVDWGARADGDLYFSSNRNSKGKNFDIVRADYTYYLRGDYRKESWEVNLRHTDFEEIEEQLLAQMNTKKYSEIGPCVFPPGWIEPGIFSEKISAFTQNPGCFYWLYANNSAGHFDIKFFYCDLPFNTTPQKQLSAGVARLINSSADDCYPTFDIDNDYIYFCSNRSGRFQIYRIRVDYNQDLGTALQSERQEAELVRDLSGDGNDKCPYMMNNIMIFTSDRSGGQGGFDLYFSKYSQGRWSQPVNMGEKINSPKDEYRPIVNDFHTGSKRLNDLLFFSSNREGGKGGFDLYHVGTDIFRK